MWLELFWEVVSDIISTHFEKEANKGDSNPDRLDTALHAQPLAPLSQLTLTECSGV